MHRRNVGVLVLLISLLFFGRAQVEKDRISLESELDSDMWAELTREDDSYAWGLFAALEDADDEVVAQALLSLTEVVDVVPRVRERLKPFARGPRVQRALRAGEGPLWQASLITLGTLGMASPDMTPHLLGMLQGQDMRLKKATAAARLEGPGVLGMLQVEDTRLKEAAAVALLEDPDPEVRQRAARFLGSMGVAARTKAGRLRALLDDPHEAVRTTAKEALESVEGEGRWKPDWWQEPIWWGLEAFGWGLEMPFKWIRAIRQGPGLLDPDPQVRERTLFELASAGKAAWMYAPQITELLEDSDPGVRNMAVIALMQVGSRKERSRIAELVDDPDRMVRYQAMDALSQWGAREYASRLILRLNEDGMSLAKASNESKPWRALVDMTPLALEDVAQLLALEAEDPEGHSTWLARAHGLGGDNPQVERVLRWLGWRPDSQLPRELPIREARETLRDFAALWPHTGKYPALREDLAQQISRVVLLGRGGWAQEDIPLLRVHQENLGSSSKPSRAESVAVVIDSIPPRESSLLQWAAWGWAAHAGFWLLFLFVYPRSAKVQAVFFWNPWVRRLLGLGYVGLLLTWVPFLRRRLLKPFRPMLLAEAGLEHFSPQGYFGRTEVRDVSTGNREPLLEAIPRLRGQVVLEGASGMGKSMFIQYLLCHSKALAVYLPAKDCKQGVLEAIQAKLEGLARDTGFLQSLIYSGALDIYIDGLNEVAADTRARVVRFVEPKFHGNILLATQGMDWTPPVAARRYELQPLTEGQVTEFLRGREPLLGKEAKRRGAAYREACDHFLAQALWPGRTEEVRRGMLEVLSNPMDLTVVAQMLAAGHTPDLFHLQEQQYELMAREYRAVSLGEFPLEKFSEEAYQMRLEDRGAIPEERFRKELLILEDFKMVVRREWWGAEGLEGREWHFRHDKLQDFFIVQTFLGESNPRVAEHLDAPRFRGVYLQLARLLAPRQAQALRDQLVEHAAETHDHSVSDDVITLLEARWQTEQPRAQPPDSGRGDGAEPGSRWEGPCPDGA
ncbi:HEAT repeat domain-containing protein [Vitiosangium sp. GDMCC 1.1324]|uniref:HEAT repeat domain-containing protein n=1 Tax=Vitiosangium sp. (strain GDMCC 1.1324) TaxID=2138576 RepID=UPI00130DAB25|nr:HEAT repeat domain-containing protein [Vitiosangium sp. GDMCC 1.1324]